MSGYPDADRAPLCVLQATRCLAGRGQQERKRARSGRLEQAKLPGLHSGIAADFGQVSAYQRVMVVAVSLAQPSNAFQRVGIADVAAKRVATVGRVGYQPAVAQNLRGLTNQPRLRVLRVQFEILAQAANIRGRTGHGARNLSRDDPCELMQAALNFLPLAAFMLAYHYAGIYVATAVLMAAMVLLALVDYLRVRRVSPMHAVSTVLVLIFGSATLILHDPRFLKVKPTLLLWLMGLAFLGSQWIGAAPLTQRLLEPALAPGTSVSRPQWLRINLIWVAAYILLGCLNLYIARTASEQTWVYFKGFGLTIALAVLGVGQALWLHRKRQ